MDYIINCNQLHTMNGCRNKITTFAKEKKKSDNHPHFLAQEYNTRQNELENATSFRNCTNRTQTEQNYYDVVCGDKRNHHIAHDPTCKRGRYWQVLQVEQTLQRYWKKEKGDSEAANGAWRRELPAWRNNQRKVWYELHSTNATRASPLPASRSNESLGDSLWSVLA